MEDILLKVYKAKGLKNTLLVLSYVAVAVSCAAFLLMLVLAFLDSPLKAVKIAVFAGVPFVIVSLLRRLINAPRPYEIYSFYEEKPRDGKGKSFPSRHVFSAFVIGTLLFSVSIPLAVVTLTLGVGLAVCRVLLGIHFIRDVVAGGLIGALSGVIGLLILL